MSPRSELTPGESLGGWTILRPLAKGGMGAVYAARNELSGAVRALKVVRADLVAQADTRARFVREVALATRVRHPNLVEAFDPLVIDGQVVLPMELLEGETLAARLGRGPLEILEAMALVRTLADAVAAIHESGIIHRDLKPANVFLARDASGAIVPKILDLGAAREIEGPKHTQTGHTIGSPAYMAPEQARAEKDLDGRLDVYALGVLLYATLTCRKPVESDEHGSAIAKLIQGVDVVPPRVHRPEIPAALEAIVLQAMAQRREQRFASAAALRAALDALREQLERAPAREVPRTRISSSALASEAALEDASPTTKDPVAEPASKPRLVAFAVLAFAGLLVAGAVAFAAVWTSLDAPTTVSIPSTASSPTSPSPASPSPASPSPASASPASTSPVSASPVSASPVSASPVSASPVPSSASPAPAASVASSPPAPSPSASPLDEGAPHTTTATRRREPPASSREPSGMAPRERPPERGAGLWLDEP